MKVRRGSSELDAKEGYEVSRARNKYSLHGVLSRLRSLSGVVVGKLVEEEVVLVGSTLSFARRGAIAREKNNIQSSTVTITAPNRGLPGGHTWHGSKA